MNQKATGWRHQPLAHRLLLIDGQAQAAGARLAHHIKSFIGVTADRLIGAWAKKKKHEMGLV